MLGKDKMLSPQDIKNKTFSRTMFGYNADEVDEYIDFICEKYESLCLEKDELQYKLDAAVDGLSATDKKINSDEAQEAIMIAKKKADEIVAEAEEQSKLLYKAAQDNADRVLKDFRRQIEDEARLLDYLKKHTVLMKNKVVKVYEDAIKETIRIAPDEKYTIDTNVDVIVQTVLDGIRKDIENDENDTATMKPIRSRAVPGKGDFGKLKGKSIREKIKAINSENVTDENNDTDGQLISDTGKKEN